MTDAAAVPARELVAGKSLWRDAWLRLKANKAAMTSLVILALMTLACFFGPLLTPHGYDTVYQNYVKVPPALEARPSEAEVEDALETALRRGRVDIAEWTVEGDALQATLTAEREIDPRITRLVNRSDVFANATVLTTHEEGRTLVIGATVERARFLLGTDQNGRDLQIGRAHV